MCARGAYTKCPLTPPPVAEWSEWRAVYDSYPLLVSREERVSSALDPSVPMPPFGTASSAPAEAVLAQLQSTSAPCAGVLAVVNTGADAAARARGLAAGDEYAAAAAEANDEHTTQLCIACGQSAAMKLCTDEIATATSKAAAARARHTHVVVGRIVGGKDSLQKALDTFAAGGRMRIESATVHVNPFEPESLAREREEEAAAARKEAEEKRKQELAGRARGAWFSNPAEAARLATEAKVAAEQDHRVGKYIALKQKQKKSPAAPAGGAAAKTRPREQKQDTAISFEYDNDDEGAEMLLRSKKPRTSSGFDKW